MLSKLGIHLLCPAPLPGHIAPMQLWEVHQIGLFQRMQNLRYW